RVEHHQHHLIVAGLARADFLIGGIWREPARVADRGDVNPVAQLPELAFGAPEASQAENRGLKALRIWPLKRAAVDEMSRRREDRFLAARQCRGGAWHLKLFLEREHPHLLVDLATDRYVTYKLRRAVSHAFPDHRPQPGERGCPAPRKEVGGTSALRFNDRSR